MKITSILVGFWLWLLASLSFGATLRETAGGPDTAGTVMNLNGAILIDGTASPGFEIGVATRISNEAPLYIGGETGAFVSTGFPSYVIFPFLAELYYQFNPVSVVHPLLGVMAGPYVAPGGNISTARFGFLARPGLNFELGRRAVLNIEARFGAIGSVFVVIPQIGAIFAI